MYQTGLVMKIPKNRHVGATQHLIETPLLCATGGDKALGEEVAERRGASGKRSLREEVAQQRKVVHPPIHPSIHPPLQAVEVHSLILSLFIFSLSCFPLVTDSLIR